MDAAGHDKGGDAAASATAAAEVARRPAAGDGADGGWAARLAILGSAVLFSTGGVAIKGTVLGAWQVAGLRALVAAAAVAVLVPGAVVIRRREVLLTGLAQGLSMLLFVLANKNTTAANAIFLQSSAPLYIPLLAAALLGERTTKRDLAAMAGIAVGLACFLAGASAPSATAPSPRLGDLFAIASGLSWACTVVGLRLLARGNSSPVTTRPTASDDAGDDGAPSAAVERAAGTAKGALIAGNLFVAALALPMAFPLPSAAGAGDAAILLFLGVAQVGLAYRLLVRGVARVPALEASLLALFEPVLNPIWAFVLLGERPSSWALAGAAVLAAVTVARAAAGSRTDPLPP